MMDVISTNHLYAKIKYTDQVEKLTGRVVHIYITTGTRTGAGLDLGTGEWNQSSIKTAMLLRVFYLKMEPGDIYETHHLVVLHLLNRL